MNFVDRLSSFVCGNKASKPKFCLWTFPVLVDGPFGVVSVAEFIGILLVVAFVINGSAAYIIQSWQTISQSQVSAFDKRCGAISNGCSYLNCYFVSLVDFRLTLGSNALFMFLIICTA